MSHPTPRRPSRTTTSRPRKIAGRDEAPAETTTSAAPASPAAPEKDATPPTPPKPPRRPVAKGPDEPADSSAPAGAGRTSTLLAVLGVLVLALVLQCGWFVWNAVRDVEVETASSSADDERDDDTSIEVPSGRPVVLNQLAVQEGVDAAASAAQVMFARNWKSYDEGVDNAVALMTDEFGEEFRTTTEDVRQEFVRKQTEVQVRVVAQSVVRANETELEALIFLNQYVFRGEGKDAKSTYTPYRALLTMVHTGNGWLVDGVDTK
jgi:Mce-associated membrane protein